MTRPTQNPPEPRVTVRKIVRYTGSTFVRYADIALPRIACLEKAA